MIQSIAAEKTVDVFGYVMTLRRDRNIMVQVEEQYVFIHEVLLEAIHSGYTEIRANDLRSHMKLLMQVSPSTGTSFLHLFFKFGFCIVKKAESSLLSSIFATVMLGN